MKPVLLSLAAAVWLVSCGAAFADVIDGNWCAADGRNMQIAGPTITTPGGHTIQGTYSRHSFSYTVPQPEPSAGTSIYMRLLNEQTVDLWKGTAGGDATTPEVWKRCMPISDAAPAAVAYG